MVNGIQSCGVRQGKLYETAKTGGSTPGKTSIGVAAKDDRYTPQRSIELGKITLVACSFLHTANSISGRQLSPC